MIVYLQNAEALYTKYVENHDFKLIFIIAYLFVVPMSIWAIKMASYVLAVQLCIT